MITFFNPFFFVCLFFSFGVSLAVLSYCSWVLSSSIALGWAQGTICIPRNRILTICIQGMGLTHCTLSLFLSLNLIPSLVIQVLLTYLSQFYNLVFLLANIIWKSYLFQLELSNKGLKVRQLHTTLQNSENLWKWRQLRLTMSLCCL